MKTAIIYIVSMMFMFAATNADAFTLSRTSGPGGGASIGGASGGGAMSSSAVRAASTPASVRAATMSGVGGGGFISSQPLGTPGSRGIGVGSPINVTNRSPSVNLSDFAKLEDLFREVAFLEHGINVVDYKVDHEIEVVTIGIERVAEGVRRIEEDLEETVERIAEPIVLERVGEAVTPAVIGALPTMAIDPQGVYLEAIMPSTGERRRLGRVRGEDGAPGPQGPPGPSGESGISSDVLANFPNCAAIAAGGPGWLNSTHQQNCSHLSCPITPLRNNITCTIDGPTGRAKNCECRDVATSRTVVRPASTTCPGNNCAPSSSCTLSWVCEEVGGVVQSCTCLGDVEVPGIKRIASCAGQNYTNNYTAAQCTAACDGMVNGIRWCFVVGANDRIRDCFCVPNPTLPDIPVYFNTCAQVLTTANPAGPGWLNTTYQGDCGRLTCSNVDGRPNFRCVRDGPTGLVKNCACNTEGATMTLVEGPACPRSGICGGTATCPTTWVCERVGTGASAVLQACQCLDITILPPEIRLVQNCNAPGLQFTSTGRANCDAACSGGGTRYCLHVGPNQNQIQTCFCVATLVFPTTPVLFETCAQVGTQGFEWASTEDLNTCGRLTCPHITGRPNLRCARDGISGRIRDCGCNTEGATITLVEGPACPRSGICGGTATCPTTWICERLGTGASAVLQACQCLDIDVPPPEIRQVPDCATNGLQFTSTGRANCNAACAAIPGGTRWCLHVGPNQNQIQTCFCIAPPPMLPDIAALFNTCNQIPAVGTAGGWVDAEAQGNCTSLTCPNNPGGPNLSCVRDGATGRIRNCVCNISDTRIRVHPGSATCPGTSCTPNNCADGAWLCEESGGVIRSCTCLDQPDVFPPDIRQVSSCTTPGLQFTTTGRANCDAACNGMPGGTRWCLHVGANQNQIQSCFCLAPPVVLPDFTRNFANCAAITSGPGWVGGIGGAHAQRCTTANLNDCPSPSLNRSRITCTIEGATGLAKDCECRDVEGEGGGIVEIVTGFPTCPSAAGGACTPAGPAICNSETWLVRRNVADGPIISSQCFGDSGVEMFDTCPTQGSSYVGGTRGTRCVDGNCSGYMCFMTGGNTPRIIQCACIPRPLIPDTIRHFVNCDVINNSPGFAAGTITVQQCRTTLDTCPSTSPNRPRITCTVDGATGHARDCECRDGANVRMVFRTGENCPQGGTCSAESLPCATQAWMCGEVDGVLGNCDCINIEVDIPGFEQHSTCPTTPGKYINNDMTRCTSVSCNGGTLLCQVVGSGKQILQCFCIPGGITPDTRVGNLRCASNRGTVTAGNITYTMRAPEQCLNDCLGTQSCLVLGSSGHATDCRCEATTMACDRYVIPGMRFLGTMIMQEGERVPAGLGTVVSAGTGSLFNITAAWDNNDARRLCQVPNFSLAVNSCASATRARGYAGHANQDITVSDSSCTFGANEVIHCMINTANGEAFGCWGQLIPPPIERTFENCTAVVEAQGACPAGGCPGSVTCQEVTQKVGNMLTNCRCNAVAGACFIPGSQPQSGGVDRWGTFFLSHSVFEQASAQALTALSTSKQMVGNVQAFRLTDAIANNIEATAIFYRHCHVSDFWMRFASCGGSPAMPRTGTHNGQNYASVNFMATSPVQGCPVNCGAGGIDCMIDGPTGRAKNCRCVDSGPGGEGDRVEFFSSCNAVPNARRASPFNCPTNCGASVSCTVRGSDNLIAVCTCNSVPCLEWAVTSANLNRMETEGRAMMSVALMERQEVQAAMVAGVLNLDLIADNVLKAELISLCNRPDFPQTFDTCTTTGNIHRVSGGGMTVDVMSGGCPTGCNNNPIRCTIDGPSGRAKNCSCPGPDISTGSITVTCILPEDVFREQFQQNPNNWTQIR